MDVGRLLCLPYEAARKVQNIWEKDLLWILRAASSSYELPALPPLSPHVATPTRVFSAATAKIMCNNEFFFS